MPHVPVVPLARNAQHGCVCSLGLEQQQMRDEIYCQRAMRTTGCNIAQPVATTPSRCSMGRHRATRSVVRRAALIQYASSLRQQGRRGACVSGLIDELMRT